MGMHGLKDLESKIPGVAHSRTILYNWVNFHKKTAMLEIMSMFRFCTLVVFSARNAVDVHILVVGHCVLLSSLGFVWTCVPELWRE